MTLELLTITEAGRRLAVVGNTLKRRIARAEIKPDAVLVEGGSRQHSPLFVESRLGELAKLMGVTNPPR